MNFNGANDELNNTEQKNNKYNSHFLSQIEKLLEETMTSYHDQS